MTLFAVSLGLACRQPPAESPSPQPPTLRPSCPAPTSPPKPEPTTTTAPTTPSTLPALPPNVLLVVLDDVGVDRMSAWGLFGADPTLYPATPVIAGLAAEGVTFDRAYAMPLCSPTRATILTGRYPWRTGVGNALEPTAPAGLPYDEETLPERLAAAPDRWTTSWIGKWHLSVLADPIDEVTSPLLHGFGSFEGALGSLLQKYTFDGLPQDYFDWEKDDNGALVRTTTYATTDNVDDAIARIGLGGTSPEPWFVGLAFNAAHDPWHWPPADLWSGRPTGDPGVPQQFDAMIEAADHELGRLLAAMDPEVRGRTLIAVVGDNGSPRDAATNGERPGVMKSSPYELGVRVPLIVSGPPVAAGAVGATSHRLISVADLFATVADLAGAPVAPDDPYVDGRSFVPLLADPTGPEIHSVVYAEVFDADGGDHRRMIRDPRFKLVQHVDRADELYDLGDDLLEGADLLHHTTPDALAPDAAAAYAALLAALPTPL